MNERTDLIIRPDDGEDKVIERFKVYDKKTKPLLEFYKDNLINLNAEREIEIVSNEIVEKYGK